MTCPDCEPLEEVALALEAETDYADAIQSAFDRQRIIDEGVLWRAEFDRVNDHREKAVYEAVHGHQWDVV